jgi:hypothetical protein
MEQRPRISESHRRTGSNERGDRPPKDQENDDDDEVNPEYDATNPKSKFCVII